VRTRVPKAFTKPGLTAERQYKIKLRTKWKKNVVSQKKERLDRIDEAFLHERSIDRQTYERQRDQLREQLALVEIELNDAVLDQLDVDGVLAFAEHVVTNAARLWIELDLAQKQRLEQTLFPEGLRFDGEKFGTAATCLAFKKLDGSGGSNSGIRPQREQDAVVGTTFRRLVKVA